TARPGEMIASALFAAGIRVFGHHPKDGAPQGLFCANGQCAQCMVLADGKPVKACMTPVRPGMRIGPIVGLPHLPEADGPRTMAPIETVRTPVLILGGGPAGLSAAIELGRQGIPCLLVDDKDRLGGKLVLQTHRFFGSAEAVYAGTRGIDIAKKLARLTMELAQITVWTSSTALAVFSDKIVGILRADPAHSQSAYVLVDPEVLIVATGARERSLAFPGNTLPGVYGAGAFQTLVNRDLVRPAEHLFIVGGGNVGLIAGYHALQAGIHVVGLVEALPECGGYKVHADKLSRLGVPIHTSHTILSANGHEGVASVTIAQVDALFRPIRDTRRTIGCDTLLIAVGLDPVDEFTHKARAFGMQVFDAGDAQAIAEASAAMFTGRIAGRQAAQALGQQVAVPSEWLRTAEILKSHPGCTVHRAITVREGAVIPVFHCTQEIPCNPCTAVCPQGLIQIPGDDIRALPVFVGSLEGLSRADQSRADQGCIGCERCVAICPGLAITLVDTRDRPGHATVSLPYELSTEGLVAGDRVAVVGETGASLGDAIVIGIRPARRTGTSIIRVEVPLMIAAQVVGIRVGVPPALRACHCWRDPSADR
ncbi:MAG: FAD-dependent oxidoreductase, partial [Anaerolineae bacterium]|nr:FAD-dependent oxidoreductase [Anaerolineae bacterium]